MLQSDAKLAALRLDLASHFLRHLGEPPWAILAGGTQRSFTAKTLPAMGKWIAQQQQAQRNAFALLPETGGQVWHLAITAPITARTACMALPPSHVVTAGRELWALWRLNAPIAKAEAQRLSAKLAASLPGARAVVGEPAPLPGSVRFIGTGTRLLGAYPVQTLPPLARAYRLIGGELAAPVSSHGATPDPRLLTVMLGEAEGSPVLWQPGSQSNGFMLVLGASGSGKTETLKVIGSAIHTYGVPVLVLDFHGDVHLGGVPSTLLSSGAASTDGLNPLELDLASAQDTGLYDQRAALREMIQRAVPALGHRQADILHEALGEAYARAGIHDADPTSWNRQPPSFADLLSVLGDRNADGQRHAEGVIAAVRDLFGHPVFNRASRLGIETLLSGSMRLDLSKLPDSVRFIAAETLLRRIFRALRMRGPIPVSPVDDSERFRLFVVIDEAKILALGGSRERNILGDLFTEARKFGLGMVLASQMAEHFSEEMRANAATWLVLKPQAMAEAKRNAPNVGVEPDALMALKGRGDGYYRVGNSPAQRLQIRPARA